MTDARLLEDAEAALRAAERRISPVALVEPDTLARLLKLAREAEDEIAWRDARIDKLEQERRGARAVSEHEVLYAPLSGFVRRLAQGWRFPRHVVEPMAGHHGRFAVLLVRDTAAGAVSATGEQGCSLGASWEAAPAVVSYATPSGACVVREFER